MRRLDDQVLEFKHEGFTVLEAVFSGAEVREWQERYDRLVERQTPPDANNPSYWISNAAEYEPWLLLPVVSHPDILDLAERVMGPFVQLDNLTLTSFSSVSPDRATNLVSGWHRDRYGWLPDIDHYVRPRACNALIYFQDMTEEAGPLRVIPGSHRKPIRVSEEDANRPHAQERLIPVKAGDVVFTHCALLHSGTPSTDETRRRGFLSAYYNLCSLRTTDNHSGPNTQAIIKRARENNDRRVMRLFGVDEVAWMRLNSGFTEDEEKNWEKWIREDRAASGA